jgi:Fe-S-cluster-containing dehydrogenase component
MKLDRRSFVTAAVVSAAGSRVAVCDETDPQSRAGENHAACLIDTTLCIGCRKCEAACNRANSLPQPCRPFSDRTVLRHERRPTTGAFTVVNEYPGSPSPVQPDRPTTTAKTQCMHCLDPSCVSACIVGALTKTDDGAVVYNPDICIGCRYCIIACPFEIPAYEYDRPTLPRVRKCQFCVGREGVDGANPACAAACPTEAIVFGTRTELLELARSRIEKRPDRYLDHIYGEHEVGGTSWMYLVGRPPEEVGLIPMPDKAPAETTEAIQHGIFRYGAFPIALYGLLGGLMWRSHRHERLNREDGGEAGGAA